MKLKATCVALGLLLCFGAVGCSAPVQEKTAGNASPSTQETQQSPSESVEKATVSEFGWCSTPGKSYLDTGEYQYSVILQNPNASYDLRDIALEVEGKDAQGATVFVQEEVVPLIPAGDTCSYAGKVGGGIYAASLAFSVTGATSSDPSAPKIADLLAVENAVENIGGTNDMNYAGQVKALGGLPEGFDKVKVCVVLRDKGDVLAAGYSVVIDAPAA
ncbi:MAG: hypothetical protein RR772_02480, partial [Gordonibacter sp.]